MVGMTPMMLLKSKRRNLTFIYIFNLSNCHRMLFQWIAIPWLQAEIDSWVRFKNNTAPRAVKNKILPHGIPELIRMRPNHFQALDFKV